MNKRRILPLIIVGVVTALPENVSLAQTNQSKENDVRQPLINLSAEGLDIVSPELRGRIIPDPKVEGGWKNPLIEDLMLQPETRTQEEISEMQRKTRQDRIEQAKQKSAPEYFREQLSQQIEFLANQGSDVQKLKELVERLQLALEKSEKNASGDVEVAVFAVAAEPQEHPEGNPHPAPPRIVRPMDGRPGFMPPVMQQRLRQQQATGPQVQHTEGPFAEDQERIHALKESAERLAQAGLPDAAHGLIERAGQIQRELAEKQERMQREQHERAQAQIREQHEHAREQHERMMEQHREAIERGAPPALPLRELHEQLEQLRREVHSINEKVSHLTEMIEHHHRAQERRGHHEEMDDDDDDDDDHEDDDRRHDRRERRDRDEDDDDDNDGRKEE